MKSQHFTRRLRDGSSLAALAVALGISVSAHASGLPSGGHYVSGSGDIGKSGRSVTVKQSSTTGIIDWNKFSVGKNGSVTFDNGSGATLNLVTGGNLSKIAGSMNASGSLYLINNAGVIVSGTGRVLTGGSFIASSGSLSGSAFHQDKLKLSHLDAKVINRGTIDAAASATLSGSTVRDSGRIEAAHIALKARGALSISGAAAAQTAAGAGGSVNVLARTINVSGHINTSALAAHQSGGTIDIDAQGTTTIGGRIAARGGLRGAGGQIDTSGNHVHIANGARIATLALHGATGTWLIDPTDFVIAASGGDITGAELSDELKTTDELIQSSGGGGGTQGKVIVDDAVTWASGQSLTLDAATDIDVNANIKITGAGVLNLIYGDTNQNGSGNTSNGDLLFNGGRIAFTDVTSGNDTQLNINAQAYTLVNSIADIPNSIGNSGKFFALANNYDASADGTYTQSPIETTVESTFEGLGNTISNLTINDPTEIAVALFASVGPQATIRDINLSNVNITSGAVGASVGGLAAQSGGPIEGSHVSGVISSNGGDVGGLVGVSGGTISNSGAAVNVTGGSGDSFTGGLVGLNTATISNSYATGTVVVGTGNEARGGGLVGSSSTLIENSYATGTVTGGGTSEVGGLVGFNNGTISASYATGDTTGGSGADVGGLVGISFGNGPGSGIVVESSFATGTVTGNNATIGGLIGESFNDASITDSYATGAVIGMGGSNIAGGLVGFNDAAFVDESYETGAVSGPGSVGGLVGEGFGTIGGTTADYYNSTANAEGAVGSFLAGLGSLVKGGALTFAQMQDKTQFSGWTFGTTGGGSGWVIVDQDGSLNNANSAAGGTTPMALAEYSTTITNAHQLQLMELDPTANYTLANNIDASGTAGGDVWGSQGFIAVGGNNASNNFSGVLDGQGHAISSLLIDDSVNPSVGLFGTVTGTVRDVGLLNANVTGSGSNANVGGLAGENTNGTIDASYVTGTVTGVLAVGGLVGINLDSSATIENSYAAATVTGGDTASVGGLAGQNDDATIENSHASGAVIGSNDTETSSFIGGLVGINSEGTIENSYATGATSGNGDVGGLVGENIDHSTIDASFATGAVMGSGFAGGLVGANETSTIETSFASGGVTASTGDAGGLAGENFSSGAIETSYATGAVTASDGAAGGLVGINRSSIDQSYAMGDVLGTSQVGGLVGNNSGTIDESYELGAASGSGGATVGGLIGFNTGNVGDGAADYFNSSVNSGAGVGNGNAIDVGGGLTRAQMQSAANFDWTFGGLGSGADWVIVDQDGSIDGSNGGTTPMLLSEYSTTITNAHQLQLMELDPTANYTLAKDIDAGGTAGGDVWGSAGFIAVGGNGADEFSGVFNGKNRTVSSLTIDDSTNQAVGLFGAVSGTVSNVSVTGSVSGTADNANVGGLVGYLDEGSVSNAHSAVAVSDIGGTDGQGAGGLVGFSDFGTITQSSATGNVTMNGDDVGAGGLVGINGGTISQSFASGNVMVTDPVSPSGSGNSAGGLAGVNDGGAISQSYAMGSVTLNGSGLAIGGGLVGANENGGTIDQTYSLGSVSISGATSVEAGGLVGDDEGGGNITHSYWDTQTSGVAANGDPAGLTTAQLQGTLASLGFDSSVWGEVAGSFPYLQWQFNGLTPTVISGTVKNGSGQGVSDIAFDIYAGGSQLGSGTSFADGSFYELTTASTSGGVAVVLPSAVAFEDTGPTTGISAGSAGLTLNTADASLSTLSGALASTLGTGSRFGANNSVQQIATTIGGNVALTTNGDFDFDQSLNIGSNELVLGGSGNISQSAGAITAGSLGGEDSSGNVTLNGANQIGTLQVLIIDNGDLSFTDAKALTVDEAIASDITLTTTGAGNGISFESFNEAVNMTVNSAGGISGSGIDVTTLSGSANGTVSLSGDTANLGAFTTNGHAFSYDNAAALIVAGNVNAGSAAVSLTTDSGNLTIENAIQGGTVALASAGTLTESGSGVIDAKTLTGSSDGAVTLDGKNVITDLGKFSTGNSAFSLKDDHDLTTTGTVNTGTGALALTTTGSGHDITIKSKLESKGTVTLTSAATISENGAGVIDAKTLKGSSHGNVSLKGKNVIANLGNFSTANHNFTLNDNRALTVTGKVNAGSKGKLAITTKGNLAIDGTLEGNAVNLDATGKAAESSKGVIDTSLLNVTADTGITLTSKHNKIKKLGKDRTEKGPNKVVL